MVEREVLRSRRRPPTGRVASTCVLPNGLHASNSLTFAVNGGVSPVSDEVRMR